MSLTSMFVRPEIPLIPETLALAVPDQFIIRNFVTTILCFRLDANASTEKIVSSLQQGLANAISEMPFLAGILVKESEERCSLEVDIPEDAGVEFKVCDMRHKSGGVLYDFEALAKAGFPPSALDFDILVPGTLIPPPEPVCLAIQVNFIQGGALLAFHAHHSVMDGSGLFTLYQCLARHTAAISRSQIVPQSELISAESLDRTLLCAGPTKRMMTDFPGFRPAQEDSWAAKADASRLMARLWDQAESFVQFKVLKSWWVMSPEQLQRLEEDIMSAESNGIKPTLNSTLSALCWRHISIGRRLLEREEEYSGLMTVVDIRARVDPPLPPDYVGNALMFAKARIPVKELCSTEPGALYNIASYVSESVHWWDSDKIQGLINAVEGTADMRSVEWDCDCHFGADIQVTSTMGSSSPYNIDWGQQLGNMEALRFPTGAFYDGFVTVLPRMPNGGVEFVLNVSAEVLGRLRADGEFTKYAQFLCE